MSNENNSRPLFAVGEEVILQSKAHPEYNGDAVVLSVFATTGGGPEPGNIVIKGGWAYELTIPTPFNKGWHESALRKKYPPSSLGYEELISALKADKLEPVNF